MGTRERLLLQIAALLHDCGKYISMEKVSECSYQIIMSTDIIGLSSMERQMIACAVRFNNSAFVYYEDVYKRQIYIMGVFADKDYRSVIQKTAHFADRILTIQTPDNVRALPAGELAKTVSEYNPNVQAMDTIKDAVEEAFSLAGEQDVIIAFGSLSFIGEMTDIVENL